MLPVSYVRQNLQESHLREGNFVLKRSDQSIGAIMPADHTLQSADIIPFAPYASRANRFTAADRMELLRWEARDQGGARLAIYDRRHDDPPEVGEFASIYPPDGRWATWGAVRQGRDISVWRARDGHDIGRFATMGEALAAMARSPAKRRLG